MCSNGIFFQKYILYFTTAITCKVGSVAQGLKQNNNFQ